MSLKVLQRAIQNQYSCMVVRSGQLPKRLQRNWKHQKMWYWRKMQQKTNKKLWRDRKANEEAITEVSEQRKLLKVYVYIKKRQ